MRLTTDLVSLRAQRIRWFGAFTGGRGGGSEVKGGISSGLEFTGGNYHHLLNHIEMESMIIGC